MEGVVVGGESWHPDDNTLCGGQGKVCVLK